MSSSCLLMWLEAPMQSWGFDSKFSRRDTLNFPTKSAVYGLICSALGAGGEQEELLDKLKSCEMQVRAYARAEAQPFLRDFQMVGSGYDRRDSFQDKMTLKKQDGKSPNGTGAKLTYRYYLQDSAFAVSLVLPSESLAQVIAEALQNPVWDLYLGRKACVPTDFIYRGLYIDPNDAFIEAQKLAIEKGYREHFRVLEGHCEEGEKITLNDVPLKFGVSKRYTQRMVTLIGSDYA